MSKNQGKEKHKRRKMFHIQYFQDLIIRPSISNEINKS